MREFFLGWDDPRFYTLNFIGGVGLVIVNTVVWCEHGWTSWRLVFYGICLTILLFSVLGLRRWVLRHPPAAEEGSERG